MDLQYTVETDPKRLSATTAQGRPTNATAVCGIMLGFLASGAGLVATLIGLSIVKIDPNTIQAPLPIIAIVGLAFTVPGLLLLRMSWSDYQRNKHDRENVSPATPALKDYPWNPKQFSPPRWHKVIHRLGICLFFVVFLIPFHWWAFFADMPEVKPLVIAVYIFDGIFALCLVDACKQVALALQYNGSALRFDQFPYSIKDQTLEMRWKSPHTTLDVDSGSFTLQCIHQWHEVRGVGKNSRTELIQEQQWSAQRSFEQTKNIYPNNSIILEYELPPHPEITKLNSNKPIFWQLEVHLKRRGFDFKQTYLVPLYD